MNASNQPFIGFRQSGLFLVFKPHGLVTESTGANGFSLQDWLEKELKNECKWGPHPLHRLDKGTSGWVLFAGKKSIFRYYSENWRHQVSKVYRAIVDCDWELKPQQLLQHVCKDASGKMALICSPDAPGAKKALLKYRPLNKIGHQTLLEVLLQTGRFHQIRVQLASQGLHIVGDALYGAKSQYADRGFALCAGKISFPHPITKAKVTLTNWPTFFQEKT
jgi:23S rRNA pseudouridine1911/1915/1917 synthase